MLVAATSSLTGYIARTSAERQAEATRERDGATIDLITDDLDAWSAAHATSERGGDRPQRSRPARVSSCDSRRRKAVLNLRSPTGSNNSPAD